MLNQTNIKMFIHILGVHGYFAPLN